MAYSFFQDNLQEDLEHMDILGAKGSRFAPNRCNLLLEVDDRSLTEEDLVLNIRRFRPEGFGVECFMADVLEIPMEAPIPGSDLLIWDINATLPPTGQRLWVLGVKEINMVRGEWDMAYLFDTKSTWLIAPTPEQTSGPLRCLEFFAGAYGGWKSSLEVLAKYNIHSQTVGIEIDERASKAYAMTHYANWIGPQVEIPNDWFLTNQENWIWQQDVTNPKILGPLTHWQPHVITISSPCPDWSSAGTAQGLLKPGAKLLFQTVLLSRWIRPMYIALEQVSNFNNHDHKHWILKALHSVGFRLVWQKVCNLGTHAQTNRLRWLGLAQRSSDLVPPVPFVMWPPREETWPSVCMPWTDEDRKPLCLTADIVELASSAAFLKTSVVQLPTPEVIFAKRIFKPTDVFPTFMALYGQQHHVRKEFLKKHGYLGHFVNDHDMPYHCRFLHPAEVAILHGTCNKLYLDGNYQHAWHHLGNMIATPHALLVLGNVVKAMGLCSNDLDEVFQGFHETKLTANNSCFRKTTKGGFLMRKDQMLTKDFVANVRTLEQSMHHDEYQIWSPTHGMFRNIQGFLQTKATTVTKDFVLKPAQPRFHRALSMQTETVYRSDNMPAHLGTTSEANPCQQEHALHPAVYRPDFAPAETRPAASVVPDVMTNVQSSSCPQPLYRQASHGHATPPIGTCTELKQQYRAGHKAEGSEPDPYCHAHALHPAEYCRSQSHAETPVSTASVSRTHEPDMMQINQHMHPQKGLERVDASRLPKSRDANLSTTARLADHVNNISVPETTKPCNPTEHCPQTSLPDAMPLPRLGCGGPSLDTHMTNDRANKVDAYADPLTAENSCALGPSEVDKAQQMHTPQVDANDRDCPTSQLRCHAMPLPRLGCGGPTHDDDQTMTEASKTNIKRESMQDAEPDHLTKRHCSGSSGSAFDQHDHTEMNPNKGCHSPITVISESPTASETVQFQPVLKGTIQWKNYHEAFWFAADLPATHLERVWELGTCCQFLDLQEPTTAILKPLEVYHEEEIAAVIPRTCVQVLIDDELSLMKVEPQVPLLSQQHISNLARELHDQFGILNEGQTADYGTILLTEALTHGVNAQDLIFVLAAFTQTKMTWHTCRLTNRIVANFSGDHTAVTFLRKFFAHALTSHSLNLLGRQVMHKDDGELIFAPNRDTGVAPANPFLIALSIAAAKTLMDSLEVEDDDCAGHLITLKWAGRPVWKGKIHANTTLATLECIMRYCLAPWGSVPAFRMICQGHQAPLENTISQLPRHPDRDDVLIHAIMSLKGGGQGTKVQQRAVQQNALASTLLDHGFNLAWTTKAVDTVMDKFGLGKLQSVNAQPMGNAKIQAVIQLCKEAGVTIPEVPKPKSGNDLPGSNAQRRKKRAMEFKLNPSDYTLIEGFFTREDGTTMPQVSQIVPQSCGVCILNAAQAEVWVREGQKISADELGLLVLGPISVHQGLTSEEITFPSFNTDHQMVLLTGTLVQLGAEVIQHKQGDPKQVPSETCSLVAVTMYKEDWNDDDWKFITTNPAAMVRKQLENEGLSQGIQAVWGKSLRNNRAPATPVQAMTVQVHMTVEDAMLERLLARSGFNRLFLTPKTQAGRLNAQYKVIWIPGDIPKITSLSTKCQSCVGLVRGRQGKGYGLRFHMDKLDEAWAILMPGTSPPQNNLGNMVYKLQNLPFGCTKIMLQNWAEAMKWEATPIRALGPQTWIVRSAAEIPPGIIRFNSSPILARLLPPREQQGPEKILLGPRPKPQLTQQSDPWHQGQDPWASYGPAKAMLAAPQAALPPQQGPTEKRLLEQDAKIANMQASLEQLTQSQKHHAKHVESQFKQAAQREQDNMNKMDSALKQIEKSVDKAMTKSFNQYQASMDEKFQEIKHLFMSNKRTAPPDEEDMED